MKCRFSECVILDKSIYFYEIGTGMYAKIDLNNKEVSYLDNPNGLHSTRGGDDVYYLRIFAGKIYAVDNNGENINVFDLQKNTYTRIPIYCNYAPWDNFVGCEIIISKAFHINIKADCLNAISSGRLISPTGPSLYVGFSFTH